MNKEVREPADVCKTKNARQLSRWAFFGYFTKIKNCISSGRF